MVAVDVARQPTSTNLKQQANAQNIKKENGKGEYGILRVCNFNFYELRSLLK